MTAIALIATPLLVANIALLFYTREVRKEADDILSRADRVLDTTHKEMIK